MLDPKSYSYVKAWRARSKAKLVAAFGGKCCNCGYFKCIKALDFHHLNPTQKEFSLSKWDSAKWETLVEEAKKCILVCSNCHREIHDNLLDVSSLHQIIDENLLLELKKKPEKSSRHTTHCNKQNHYSKTS